jgi:hypothetical protein
VEEDSHCHGPCHDLDHAARLPDPNGENRLTQIGQIELIDKYIDPRAGLYSRQLGLDLGQPNVPAGHRRRIPFRFHVDHGRYGSRIHPIFGGYIVERREYLCFIGRWNGSLLIVSSLDMTYLSRFGNDSFKNTLKQASRL